MALYIDQNSPMPPASQGKIKRILEQLVAPLKNIVLRTAQTDRGGRER